MIIYAAKQKGTLIQAIWKTYLSAYLISSTKRDHISWMLCVIDQF